MKNFMLVAAVAAVLLALVGGQSLRGDPGPEAFAGVAKPLNQIPVVQWFQGYFPGVTMASPFRVTLPANLGFALTLVAPENGNDAKMDIKVNGVKVRRAGSGAVGQDTQAASMESPILVPPGATLEILPSVSLDLNIGGYLLTLSDLGLQ